MRFVSLVTAAYVALAFDAALVDLIAVDRVVPDLLAIVALVWLLSCPASAQAVVAAAAIGLAADLAAGGRIGAGMASFACVGYAATKLRTKIDTDHPLVQTALTWPAATAIALAVAVARVADGELATPAWAAIVRSLFVGGYTAAASLPVWMVLSWIRQPLVRRRQRLADAW
jgi:rod shape-determining protein MreD